MRRALIDADILVYRIGFAVEKKWYVLTGRYESFGEDVLMEFKYKKELDEYVEQAEKDGMTDIVINTDVRIGSLTSAIYSLESMIKTIKYNTCADVVEFYLSGSDNFRYDVAKTQPYKAKRPPKPAFYQKIRDYLIEKHGATVSVGHEADDDMGIAQYQDYLNSNCDPDVCQTIICTIDKDLRMIPGYHYHIEKQTIDWVTEEEGDFWFWTQLIMGDSTDTIPGVPGYGKKKAEKLMDESDGFPEIYESEVCTLYINAFGDDWKDVINEQAQLLWIRRYPDEIKEVV